MTVVQQRWMRAIPALLAVALLAGCATYDRRAGVANMWRDEIPSIEKGATTQAEILEAFGPPSQMISLGDGVVFYCLRERTKGVIQVFILYNRQAEDIVYDRAVFFFDSRGVLTEYGFSEEEIPRE